MHMCAASGRATRPRCAAACRHTVPRSGSGLPCRAASSQEAWPWWPQRTVPLLVTRASLATRAQAATPPKPAHFAGRRSEPRHLGRWHILSTCMCQSWLGCFRVQHTARLQGTRLRRTFCQKTPVPAARRPSGACSCCKHLHPASPEQHQMFSWTPTCAVWHCRTAVPILRVRACNNGFSRGAGRQSVQSLPHPTIDQVCAGLGRVNGCHEQR